MIQREVPVLEKQLAGEHSLRGAGLRLAQAYSDDRVGRGIIGSWVVKMNLKVARPGQHCLCSKHRTSHFPGKDHVLIEHRHSE
jgi:hypothetical protein